MLPKNVAKYIQSLHHKKFREQYDIFIAEGPKVVTELLKRQPGWLQEVYGTKEWKQAQPAYIWEKIAGIFIQVEQFELEKISVLQTPQQVLALATIPKLVYDQDDTWVIVLDGIQDPGNLGTIIRTAHWFGIYQLICSPDCADAFSPKVVQASMGSLFSVKVIYQDLSSFFLTYKLPVYGASLDGENISDRNITNPGAIIIGNEGRGISDGILPYITKKITIPGAGDAESLNAAVAGGILMSRITQQSLRNGLV